MGGLSMQYFIIMQDNRYKYSPRIDNFNSFIFKKKFSPALAHTIDDINVVFSQNEHALDNIDFINSQICLVSEAMKEVFSLCESSLKYKVFCILNNKREQNFLYYAPIIRHIDCLSNNSITSPDLTYVKKLVLVQSKIGNACIFKVKNLVSDIVIIRLDVAECLLRNNITGFTLSRVEVE